MSGRPSTAYLNTLEDSELMPITKDNWQSLLETMPNFKRFIDTSSNISKSAETPYENFVIHFSSIHNRIPLYMIASFLCLTRETLSRIRKQSVKK